MSKMRDALDSVYGKSEVVQNLENCYRQVSKDGLKEVSIEELANEYAKQLLYKNKKQIPRVEKWLKRVGKVEYPYLEVYKNEINVAKIIKANYVREMDARVDREFIVKTGKELGDGFVGLGIKRENYTPHYIVSVEDGARGVLFQQEYRRYPREDDLYIDSLFGIDNRRINPQEVSTTAREFLEQIKDRVIRENLGKERAKREGVVGTKENMREAIKSQERYFVALRKRSTGMRAWVRRDYLLRGIQAYLPHLTEEDISLNPIGFRLECVDGVIRVKIGEKRVSIKQEK